jgi:archaemetzincin
VKTLYVVAIGNISAEVLDWVESVAAEWFVLPVRRLPGLPIPEGSYDEKRGQYKSVELMKAVAGSVPPDAAKILGVTEADLAIPTLTFLFGQAQLGGVVAVVSLCRLRQEFYGLPGDASLLRERMNKEVLHELGHTFGLVHCSEPKCAMSLATHIGMVDNKEARYCGRCGVELVQASASANGE